MSDSLENAQKALDRAEEFVNRMGALAMTRYAPMPQPKAEPPLLRWRVWLVINGKSHIVVIEGHLHYIEDGTAYFMRRAEDGNNRHVAAYTAGLWRSVEQVAHVER